MTVRVEKENITLRLSFDNGMVDGKQKLKTKSYNRIKKTAEDQNLFNTAEAIGQLQSKNLELISKVETSSLLV